MYKRLVSFCIATTVLVVLVNTAFHPIPAEAGFKTKVLGEVTTKGVEILKRSAGVVARAIRDGVTYDAIKLALAHFFSVPPPPIPPECLTCDQALLLVRELRTDLNEIQGQFPALTEAIAQSSGELRLSLLELQATTRTQVQTLEKLLEGQALDLQKLALEQDELVSHVDRLSARLDELETRVDDLADRVAALEDALIADCKDRRVADVIGEESFRVRPTMDTEIEQQQQEDNLTVRVRVLLDTCTADLTERGVLVQISALTRGLSHELEAYLTLNRVGGGTAEEMIRPALRERHRIGRPAARLDGLVREIFVPYDALPLDRSSNQMGLAITVFHDGELIASVPTRVLECRFGSPTRCSWQR
jgi:hypothetical protein